MPKTILVTGAQGFVGHHLVKELHAQGVTVIGAGREKNPSEQNKPLLADYYSVDMTDKEQVDAIDLSVVDAIIHLAGLASVGQSFAEPAHFLSANSGMIINLLEHAMAEKSKARFVVVSSGAVYESKQPLPIAESGQLTHGSPYAVSKLAVEMMNDYYRSRNLEVVTMRPFNHIGPGQTKGFIAPDLLSKLRAMKENGEPITVGDLSTARDYTDVRDVARAYVAVATSPDAPKDSVYNVCSGTSTTGEIILEKLIAAVGFDEKPHVSVDPALIRPNDARNIYGDNSRLRNEFGWQPTIPLDQTLRDIAAH